MLLPQLPVDKVQKISHGKVFKYIDNFLVRHTIYPENVMDLLNELKLMRELYSYHLPLAGTFIKEEDNLKPDSLLKSIEDYYNQRRKHSTNGWKAPAHREQEWYNLRKVA